MGSGDGERSRAGCVRLRLWRVRQRVQAWEDHALYGFEGVSTVLKWSEASEAKRGAEQVCEAAAGVAVCGRAAARSGRCGRTARCVLSLKAFSGGKGVGPGGYRWLEPSTIFVKEGVGSGWTAVCGGALASRVGRTDKKRLPFPTESL